MLSNNNKKIVHYTYNEDYNRKHYETIFLNIFT